MSENDLRGRLLPALDQAVETGRLTRDEAFAVLDRFDQKQRPTVAKTWRTEQGVGLVIDDRVFPWHVAAGPGPMVEAIEVVNMHILWVPVFVEGAIPEYGRPDGEPIDDPADPRATARETTEAEDGGHV